VLLRGDFEESSVIDESLLGLSNKFVIVAQIEQRFRIVRIQPQGFLPEVERAGEIARL
jgi:hypothetical protein